MLSNVKAKIAGLGFFYRWHPSIALRYLPFVDEIKSLPEQAKILEVGSGGLGIAPYLRRKVTGVDVDFKPPFYPDLERVIGSSTHLPFTDNSFDVIVSMDMLEHLQVGKRAQAISEMIRVAKTKVLLGVPCGKKSIEEDLFLRDYYRKKFGRKFPFLEEQTEEKLPEIDDIRKMVLAGADKVGKEVNIRIAGNENLSLHRWLMKGWMTKNILVDLFYRKILLFFVPFLRIADRFPYYRQLFFVDIKHENRN